jgi:hypothetical protein
MGTAARSGHLSLERDVQYHRNAMIVKVYGNDPEGQKRYSPAVCTGCEKHSKIGNPDERHISTSYVERQNLTMRWECADSLA